MDLYPFLAWETRPVASPGSHEQMHQLVAVSAIDADGTVRWKFTLPERMHVFRLEDTQLDNLRLRQAEWSTLVRSKHGEQTLTGLLSSGTSLAIYGPWSDVIYRPEAITIADDTGVLMLDPRQGQKLLDYDRPGAGAIYDRVNVSVEQTTTGGQVLCQRQGWHSTFLIPCGKWMVYFNGSVAAVVSSTPPSVIAETPRRDEYRQTNVAPEHDHDWIIPVGPLRIHLSGMSFMK